jgi:hypothetical protein
MTLKVTLSVVLLAVWFFFVLVGTGVEYSYDQDAEAPDGTAEARRLDRLIWRTVARRSVFFVVALVLVWLVL